jgi:CRP-like cAMP-binding protein
MDTDPGSKYQRRVDDLGEAERAKLFERFGRSFEAGAAIYAEGDPGDLCYLIQEGRVRLVKRIRSSDRSLTVLRPGDLFGEDALLAGGARGASAVALTDVSALALDRQTFGILLSSNPEVGLRLVEQLVRRLRHAEEQLENAMLRDQPSRVVNTILRLAASSTKSADGHVLSISPLELSSRVGLDVDAVKRAVQQLRDGGYVRIHDERIILPDLAALRQLYELLGMKEEVRGGLV